MTSWKTSLVAAVLGSGALLGGLAGTSHAGGRCGSHGGYRGGYHRPPVCARPVHRPVFIQRPTIVEPPAVIEQPVRTVAEVGLEDVRNDSPLGRMFFDMARTAFQVNDLQTAAQHITHAAIELPGDCDVMQLHALILFAQGNYPAAVNVLGPKLEAGRVWDVNQLGSFYGSAQGYIQHFLALRTFVSQHPESVEARLLMGYHLGMLGKPDMARTEIQQVIQTNAGNTTAQQFLTVVNGIGAQGNAAAGPAQPNPSAPAQGGPAPGQGALAPAQGAPAQGAPVQGAPAAPVQGAPANPAQPGAAAPPQGTPAGVPNATTPPPSGNPAAPANPNPPPANDQVLPNQSAAPEQQIPAEQFGQDKPSTPIGQVQQVPAHVGKWNASLSNGSTVELTLQADGSFRWNAVTNGKTSAFAGTFTLGNNVLTLARSDNQQLAGQVTFTGNNTFAFKLNGSQAPALTFTR